MIWWPLFFLHKSGKAVEVFRPEALVAIEPVHRLLHRSRGQPARHNAAGFCALDQACVPDYFVSWIVFHEMLHGKHEVRRTNGRRRFHTHEFLTEEKTFPDYERACAWEKANLDRLLRS